MEEPKYGWWFPTDVSVHGHEIDAIKLARGGRHGERLRPNNPDSRARVERGVINGPSEDANREPDRR